MILSELLVSPAFPFATFLLGLLLGHRFALWRDVRKEFNDSAAVMRTYLLEQIEFATPNKKITAFELDRFVSQLNFWQKKGFSNAWAAQEQARQNATVMHGHLVTYSDRKAIGEALRLCLPYTNRR